MASAKNVIAKIWHCQKKLPLFQLLFWNFQEWFHLQIAKNWHCHEEPHDMEMPKMASVETAKKWPQSWIARGWHRCCASCWEHFFISNGHSAVLAMEDGLCHCWPDYLAFFMALPLMVFWYILVAGFLVVTALASWLVAGFLVVPALDSWFILVAGFLVVPALVIGSLGLDILWCTPAGMDSVHGAWHIWQHGSTYSLWSHTQDWLHIWHAMAKDGPGGMIMASASQLVSLDFMAVFMVFVVVAAFMAFMVLMAMPFMTLAFMELWLAAGLDILAMASSLGLGCAGGLVAFHLGRWLIAACKMEIGAMVMESHHGLP